MGGGWIDLSDDGTSYLWTTRDGRQHLVGDLDVLLAEEETERSALKLTDDSGDDRDEVLHVVMSDSGGLSAGAVDLLREDRISPFRRGRGTAEHEAAVEDTARRLDPKAKGRPAGHDDAVSEVAAALGRRKGRAVDHEAQLAEAESMLRRRSGEAAKRNSPADPADWRGTEAELQEARRQIGGTGIVASKPKPKPPERPERPSRGEGWHTMGQGAAQGGRRQPGRPASLDRTLPPSMRRRSAGR